MTYFNKFYIELSLREQEMVIGGGGNSSKQYVGNGLYYRGSTLYSDIFNPPKGSLYEFKDGDSEEIKTVKREMFQDALESNPCHPGGMICFHPEVFQKYDYAKSKK